MNAVAPAFGCTAGGVPFADALDRVLALPSGMLPAEVVSVEGCVGRVLACPVVARLNLPRFDQSAMDGYAIDSATSMPGAMVPVTGRTAAGEAPGRLTAGGAHRILTGAPLPDGADTVLAQEQVHRHGAFVGIAAVPPAGTNVRRRGEDIRAGTELIATGTRLDWRHVTILAAQGIPAVQVRRAVRVTLLSSGRELGAPGAVLAPGQVHDSNSPMLAALLAGWGAVIRHAPTVTDDAAAVRRALQAAAEDADLVLTTAGISVGDEDHIRDALRALGGDLSVLKVAMKPGKPLAAGRLGGAVFIGLPGNPQAALAGAVGFVRPLLARLAGAPMPEMLRVHAGFALKRKMGRTEFIPARLVQRGACLWAECTGPDGAARLAPLLAASGFVCLGAESDDAAPGDLVRFAPFRMDAIASQGEGCHARCHGQYDP